MQTVKNLISSNNDRKLGNHKKVIEGLTEKYYYYYTVICEVNHKDKIITLDSSFGSSSTTRAVNSYRRELEYLVKFENYNLIEK